jgi:hypothetical protein
MEIQDFAQNVTSIPLDPFPPVKCQPYYKVGLKKNHQRYDFCLLVLIFCQVRYKMKNEFKIS